MNSKQALDIIYKTINNSEIRNDLCLIGAYNLNLYLKEYDVSLDMVQRGTHDLDFDYSSVDAKKYLTEDLIKELRKQGYNVDYKLVDRGDSFTIKYNFEGYNIQIDANLKKVFTKQATIYYMLANKFSSVSSETIYRRAKDVFDIFIIGKYLLKDQISLNKVINELEKHDRQLYDFMCFKSSDNIEKLKHALEKYRPCPIPDTSIDQVILYVMECSKILQQEKNIKLRMEKNNDRSRRNEEFKSR